MMIRGPIAVFAVTALGLGATVKGMDAVAPQPAPALEVHSIRFIESCRWNGEVYQGCIAQHRTVTPPDHAPYLAAGWEAQLVEARTGNVVPECDGDGWDDYMKGEFTRTMPSSVWVDQPGCTLDALPPGEYKPVAVWKWGTEEIAATGPAFEVK